MHLRITYRKEQPLSAYLTLDRRSGDSSARTEKLASGLVVDYAGDGRAIGIEISNARTVTRESINAALSHVQHPPVEPRELQPLLPM